MAPYCCAPLLLLAAARAQPVGSSSYSRTGRSFQLRTTMLQAFSLHIFTLPLSPMDIQHFRSLKNFGFKRCHFFVETQYFASRVTRKKNDTDNAVRHGMLVENINEDIWIPLGMTPKILRLKILRLYVQQLHFPHEGAPPPMRETRFAFALFAVVSLHRKGRF